MSSLLGTAAPVNEETNVVLTRPIVAPIKSGCAALPASDTDTMRRHKCFMSAGGQTVCTPDIHMGQHMIVGRKL